MGNYPKIPFLSWHIEGGTEAIVDATNHMVSPDKMIDLLPDQPLSLDQVEGLENVTGIDSAQGCAGGGEGEHAIVIAGGNWSICIAYTTQWELVDSIVGDCRREDVVELMNKTAMYRGNNLE